MEGMADSRNHHRRAVMARIRSSLSWHYGASVKTAFPARGESLIAKNRLR